MKKHITPIQIRFKDVDALGHVNHANHLTYLELARVTFLDKKLGDKIDWKKNGIIVANININYISPILLRDKIVIETWCEKIGNKSFNLHHRIIKKINLEEAILATAETTLVCFDYEKNISIEIPENWKSKIS